jgi:hypothetical protein
MLFLSLLRKLLVFRDSNYRSKTWAATWIPILNLPSSEQPSLNSIDLQILHQTKIQSIACLSTANQTK